MPSINDIINQIYIIQFFVMSTRKPETIDQFKIVKILAVGINATIFLAAYLNQKVVLKKFSTQLSQEAEKEYKFTKNFNHPNIVKVYGLRSNAKHYLNDTVEICSVIIMEYVENGELFQFIQKWQGFPENLVRTYFKMLLDGVQAIHQAGIAHLDLKLENLLIDKNFNLKIADFGLSTNHSEIYNFSIGTPGYMAPEVEKGQCFNSIEADIFATGVILFMMRTALRPFNSSNPSTDTYSNSLNNQKERFWREFNEISISDELKDLIQKMLSQNVDKRLTINEIKKHKWLRGECLQSNRLMNLMRSHSKDQIFQIFN